MNCADTQKRELLKNATRGKLKKTRTKPILEGPFRRGDGRGRLAGRVLLPDAGTAKGKAGGGSLQVWDHGRGVWVVTRSADACVRGDLTDGLDNPSSVAGARWYPPPVRRWRITPASGGHDGAGSCGIGGYPREWLIANACVTSVGDGNHEQGCSCHLDDGLDSASSVAGAEARA